MAHRLNWNKSRTKGRKGAEETLLVVMAKNIGPG